MCTALKRGMLSVCPTLSRAIGKSGSNAMSGGLNRSMQTGNVRHASDWKQPSGVFYRKGFLLRERKSMWCHMVPFF